MLQGFIHTFLRGSVNAIGHEADASEAERQRHVEDSGDTSWSTIN
jgi:hypothetical protein